MGCRFIFFYQPFLNSYYLGGVDRRATLNANANCRDSFPGYIVLKRSFREFYFPYSVSLPLLFRDFSPFSRFSNPDVSPSLPYMLCVKLSRTSLTESAFQRSLILLILSKCDLDCCATIASSYILFHSYSDGTFVIFVVVAMISADTSMFPVNNVG